MATLRSTTHSTFPWGAIATILGIDPDDGDQFRAWVTDIVAVGADDAEAMQRAVGEVRDYMAAQMARRRSAPGTDLISHLVTTELDGEPMTDDMIERILVLQLVAGIDTTWSSIGRRAVAPRDPPRRSATPRRRTRADPDSDRGAAPGLRTGERRAPRHHRDRGRRRHHDPRRPRDDDLPDRLP